MRSAGGLEYRVTVWLPPGEPPEGGFPAIYVLDANALFGTFVEALRRSSRRFDATGIHPAAVIGIAHDDALIAENDLRQRDFTAGPPADGVARPAFKAGSVGGAPAFLAFLADELAPQLRRELPLAAARQALFGHSLAGHFVLRALAARPDAFRTWAAISPSIWWDEAGLRAALAAALKPGDAVAPQASQNGGPRVFMAVGEWEDAVPPWQRSHPGHEQLVARRAERRMVASAQSLSADLSAWLGPERVVFRLFPEEDHASILMIAVQRVLRFASI
jgi:predicted alpha/beta superfamily hydrolase